MWTLAIIKSVVPIIAPASQPKLDVLMLTEFITGVLTLLLWMHARQSRPCVLALAICLMAMAFYAFIHGAWPVGIITCVWSVDTFRRWLQGKDISESRPTTARLAITVPSDRWESQSRFERMFGLN